MWIACRESQQSQHLRKKGQNESLALIATVTDHTHVQRTVGIADEAIQLPIVVVVHLVTWVANCWMALRRSDRAMRAP